MYPESYRVMSAFSEAAPMQAHTVLNSGSWKAAMVSQVGRILQYNEEYVLEVLGHTTRASERVSTASHRTPQLT